MSLYKGYEGKKLINIKIFCDGCQNLILYVEDNLQEDNYFQKKNGNDYCEICSRGFKYRQKEAKPK